MTPRALVSALALCLSLPAACNSPSTPAPNPTKPAVVTPPKTDRALPAADQREPELAKAVAQMLSNEHLVRADIDDALSAQAFAEYLKRLDPGKAFLLKSHVDELRAHETNMDDQLKAGDLVLARLASVIMLERQAVVAAMVAEQLKSPFDFTVDESIEVDGEKRAFATSDEALRDLWRKTLKLRVLETVSRMAKTRESLAKAITKAKTEEERELAKKSLAKIPATDAEREVKARTDLAKSYAGRFSRLAKQEPLESAEGFLNAITSMFDPHTVYLAPAESANFDIAMSGSLEGIGAVLREDDHYIRVQEIVPGGASSRQGKLKAGDLIMTVAQDAEEAVDVADMRINQVVEMIRGPAGTRVTLTVKKPDDRIETIRITRDVVQIEESYARGAIIDVGSGTQPVGLVYLPSFYGNTRSRPGQTPQRNATDDVRDILAALKAKNVAGVILDLRANGGGLLDQARDISGMFYQTGPVVQTRYGGGETEVLVDRDESVSFDGSVVVLVDRFSASASEIVAAALQDYSRAVIVGTATHGKGTVQVLIDLTRMARQSDKPLGVLKLTIQQFFRINGGSTQWRGVIPDITLPDPAAHIESGERFLDHAIKWSEVAAVDYRKSPPPNWSLSDINKKSAARVAGSDVFKKVVLLSQLAKARRDRTTVSLKRDTWATQRQADEKALEAADPKIGEGPALFKVTVVKAGKQAPAPSGKKPKAKNDRIENWKKSLARDPWVAESVKILADMN